MPLTDISEYLKSQINPIKLMTDDQMVQVLTDTLYAHQLKKRRNPENQSVENLQFDIHSSQLF